MCRTIQPDPQARALRDALGQFATGVAVVTASDEQDNSIGITINSFASVSLTPALVSWCIARRAGRYRIFAQAERFCISILGDDQQDVARRFAASHSAAIETASARECPPAIQRARASFQCETMHRFMLGDHLMLVGRITDFECRPGSPLVFAQGAFRTTAQPQATALAA